MFGLGRLDSDRASLAQIYREVGGGRSGLSSGACGAFRNTVLGLPSTSGAADIDQSVRRLFSTG